MAGKTRKQSGQNDLFGKLEEQGEKLDNLTKLLEKTLAENADLRKKVEDLEIKLTIHQKNLDAVNKVNADNLDIYGEDVVAVDDVVVAESDDDEYFTDESIFEGIDPVKGVCLFKKKNYDILILSDSISGTLGFLYLRQAEMRNQSIKVSNFVTVKSGVSRW